MLRIEYFLFFTIICLFLPLTFVKLERLLGFLVSLILSVIYSSVWAIRPSDVGTDTKVYVNYFLNFDVEQYAFWSSEYLSTGYDFFLFFIRVFSHNPEAYLFFSSFIPLFMLLAFALLYFKDGRSIILFFLLVLCSKQYLILNLNINRQLFSVVLFFGAFCFFDRRKFYIGSLFFILSCIFHIVALVPSTIAIIYYFLRGKVRVRYLLIFMFISLSLFGLFSGVLVDALYALGQNKLGSRAKIYFDLASNDGIAISLSYFSSLAVCLIYMRLFKVSSFDTVLVFHLLFLIGTLAISDYEELVRVFIYFSLFEFILLIRIFHLWSGYLENRILLSVFVLLLFSLRAMLFASTASTMGNGMSLY